LQHLAGAQDIDTDQPLGDDEESLVLDFQDVGVTDVRR
jgi:hypothetical protein